MEVLMHKAEDDTDAEFWKESLNNMLAKGLRVLGFAIRKFDNLPSIITPE